MVFSSLEFIVFFFPIALLVNYILPKKLQNYWLLAASLFFYAWGEPKFCFLLVLSIVFNYSAALLLEKRPKKWIFAIILLLNLGTLFVYKYLNVTTGFLNKINPDIKQTSIIIPLGISFYTFQAVSYIFDVYRGMKAEENFIHFALYITFFPQMIQGPIIRYQDFSPYLTPRRFEIERFSDGVIRFLTGLNEKVLVADILSELADAAFDHTGISVCMAWLGMLAYALQIYFDFTGYSDMAIGLGKMFGFELAENFNYPYIAGTVTDFWHRWHISLSSWFRDYLYFPLGGSRVKTKARVALNLMIVWAATGIWHGAGTQFFLWGMLHGFFVMMEKMVGLPKWLKTHKIAGKIETLFPNEKISDMFLRDENWTIHEVPNQFLGTWGKRCGKYFGGYDDLEWMTPNLPTEISYYVKNSNHFIKGQFEDVCIQKELADPRIDLYRKNNYLIQTSGDFSLVQYRNLNAESFLHILLIKDSYTLPLQTFLATDFSQIDVIDPRYYHETSLMEYTDRTRPDLVIMEVSPEAFSYDSYYKFGETAEGSVSDRTEVIPKTDFHLPFADSDNNHITYDELENDKVYTIRIQKIIVEEGNAEGISLCLHDNETDKNLTSTAFDIQYCNETQECFWTFQTPESGCEDLSLRVYSGMPGETQNNLITLIGFQMVEGKRYSE